MRNHLKLAVLIDPKEVYPPSDKNALAILTKLASYYHIKLDFLTRNALDQLPDYDGLFIRTLTGLNNYTFQWASFAEYLNLRLIDTTKGISLGSNKHLQYELCKINNVKVPKTRIIYATDNLKSFLQQLDINFPLILKTPDGSFSSGVFKLNNQDEFIKMCQKLFSLQNYYSLVVQEFVYTDYDWRIGVLNKTPLFCCKYYMAPNHWQIIEYVNNKIVNEGNAETLLVNQIPKNVLDCIYSTFSFLDDGLYGIDIKEHNNNTYLIEINDNPNIYNDVEDKSEQNRIYHSILTAFANPLLINKSAYKSTTVKKEKYVELEK